MRPSNWWFGARAQIKQATIFPAIAFGTSAVTFYTSKNSELGQLISGNAYGDFSLLSLHGEYTTATMTVSVPGGL